MFVALPGFIGSGAASYPPYGTLLSSNCSGYSAHNAGPETYTDANGVPWTEGMYTLWQEYADGAGGTYWTSNNNSSDIYSACWYPNGFCLSTSGGDNYVYWSGCGSDGTFGPWSYSVSADYADGSGGTYTSGSSGEYHPPNTGDIIYQSGVDNCCSVYYDGAGGYYISDSCGGGCTEYGTWLYDGCGSISGTDASGTYFEGAWAYGNFFADGSCGLYFIQSDININGCYYPNGWKFDYSQSSYSLHWSVSDSTATTVAEGDTTYAEGWYSNNVANGSGGTYSDSGGWSLNSGDNIASGSYIDNGDSLMYYYTVYYDGMGGFYVSQYPA